MQQAVKWRAGTLIVEPMGAQRRPVVARKLTEVSRNCGWGFGAVELYCWWYSEGSWTRTHTWTNAHTNTHHTEHQGARQGREFKEKGEKLKNTKVGGGRRQRDEDDRQKKTVSKRKCTRTIIANDLRGILHKMKRQEAQ